MAYRIFPCPACAHEITVNTAREVGRLKRGTGPVRRRRCIVLCGGCDAPVDFTSEPPVIVKLSDKTLREVGRLTNAERLRRGPRTEH